MERNKVFVNWPYYILQGLIYKGGIFDDSVFINYVNSVIPSRNVQKKVSVGAVDSRTGQFVRFNEELSFDDLSFKAARGSGAIPGIFEPIEFKNMSLIDGGVVRLLDVGGAINRCKETAEKDEEITIDIIMCNGNRLDEVDPSDYNSISNYLRFKEIKNYRESMRWVEDAMTNFPRINFRYSMVPKQALDNEWVPINFSHDHNEQLIQKGMEDARELIKEGPSKAFAEAKQYLSEIPVNPEKGISFEGFTKSLNLDPIKISG